MKDEHALPSTIWVLLPVYNEAEGIVAWIRTLRNALPDKLPVRFILSDDGSTDRLAHVIHQLRQQIPGVEVLGDGKNRGPGYAFRIGFEHILTEGRPGDYVITLEADGTADPSSLPLLLEALQSTEVVLASVYLPGGGFSRTSLLRMLLSHFANGIMRMGLKLPYRTLTSFFRAYRFEALIKLHERYPGIISENGFICQVELLVKGKNVGLTTSEIPSRVYGERRIGPSKMKLLRTSLSHLRFLAVTLIRKS